MSEQRPKQLVSVSVVCALLLGVLVAAFGTGYQVSHASTSEGSTWLVKRDSSVHVNPETLKPDAEVRAPGLVRGPLANVADLGAGSVYLNDGLGGYRALDPTTMVPGPRQPGRVVAGGSGELAAAYVVDGARIGPADKPGTVATAPARIGVSVVDGAGTAWLLSGKRLYRYDGATLRKLADLGFRADWLTLVGNRPVVMSDRGDVARIDDRREPEETRHLKLPRGARITAVNDPSSTGSVAWAVLRTARTLAGVDLATGAPKSVSLVGASTKLGPPVACCGGLYVPDYGRGTVVQLAGRSLRVHDLIAAPLHRQGAPFQFFAKNGYLWINDPESREASVIDPAGRDQRFDTREGAALRGQPSAPAPGTASPDLPGGTSGSSGPPPEATGSPSPSASADSSASLSASPSRTAGPSGRSGQSEDPYADEYGYGGYDRCLGSAAGAYVAGWEFGC